MPAQRLPLTVIGGFLGAGKTTLLNHWLRDADGRRLAVLVNDFGALNLDAALIAQSGADTVALSNGCVCCSIGDDLVAALIRVIETSPPFDGIVIEASGVSDPWKIAQVGRADPALSLNAVIVLVDAAAVVDQAADPALGDSLARQVRMADLVVINKTDLVDAARLQQVHAWLDEAAPDAQRIETVDARVPSVLRDGPAIGGNAPAHDAVKVSEHTHQHDHGDQFETWVAYPTHVVSAATWRAALRAMPRGVLRLKGYLRTDETPAWAHVQFAGRHGSLHRLDTAPVDAPVLVAIGLAGRLPTAALDALITQEANATQGDIPASSAV